MHTVRHRKRRRGKGLTAKGWKRGRPSSWYGGSSRRGTITADQFTWERQLAGLTREGAADLLGVGLRTIGHWEAGHTAPSYAAFKLLRVFRQGEFIHPAWDGYRLVRGVLVTPERREFSPADLGWLGLLVGRAKLAGEIARERDRLRAQLAEASHRSGKPEAWGGAVRAPHAPLAHRGQDEVAFTLSIPAYGTESALGRGATSSTATTWRTDASIAQGFNLSVSRHHPQGGKGEHSLTPQNRQQIPTSNDEHPAIGGAA